MEQSVFGRRLRQLRTERGLTLAELAGDGMSAGYLSRLESGARQPTERAVAHLAGRLGISPAQLAESTATSLAQSLTLTTGLGRDEAGEQLAEALKASAGEDPLLRWQALWRVAEWRRRRGEFSEQRACLDELATLGTELGLPELRARTLAQSARNLRSTGDIAGAVEAATQAYEVARGEELSVHVRTAALLALVSVLAEAGRLPEAARYTDELLATVKGQSGTQWAEALWTAANIRNRQGDPATAEQLLDEAISGFSGRDDPAVWAGLRIFAVNLALLSKPPKTDIAQQRLDEVQAAMPFAGTPALEQDVLALRVHLAVATGRPADALTLLHQFDRLDGRMSYQDRLRLETRRHQALLMTGERDEALAGLRSLAEQAQESGNMDLAAEIWRLVAEALA